MAAYVIVDIEVKILEDYEKYKRLAQASVAAYRGRYIVRGGSKEILEGSWMPRRFVILEFPDVATAKAWWASPEYAEGKALRQCCADTNMIVVDGYAGH